LFAKDIAAARQPACGTMLAMVSPS